MWFDVGHGYHVDKTTGIAKGNDPESIYAVMSGKRYNGKCCFDYGNSENTDKQPVHTGDYACGAMEAIYFGNVRQNATPPFSSLLRGAPDGYCRGPPLYECLRHPLSLDSVVLYFSILNANSCHGCTIHDMVMSKGALVRQHWCRQHRSMDRCRLGVWDVLRRRQSDPS